MDYTGHRHVQDAAVSRITAFTIEGQPYSKANRRRNVVIGNKARSIKSKEALAWESYAIRQIPRTARLRLEGEVLLVLRIYYRTQRPDLDESLVLDVLQDRWDRLSNGKRILRWEGVYRNDRQVRQRWTEHHIDKLRPRVEIEVWPRGALAPAPVAL